MASAWASVDALTARLYGACLCDAEWARAGGKTGGRVSFKPAWRRRLLMHLTPGFVEAHPIHPMSFGRLLDMP
eukprot:9469748-Lingulodinium_polyedra.AAC.1